MRTIVIGIDGLDFRHLDRNAPSTPTLTALRDRGVEAPLESTHPPSIGCAWPSLYTGTDPSHHGVYGSVAYDAYPDAPRPVSRIDVRRPAVWDYLSNEGASSIVYNVPISHPADPIHGVLIPGDSPAGTEPGHPMGIRDELAVELGATAPSQSRDDSAEVSELVSSLDRRRRAIGALLGRRAWELAVVRVGELETALERADDAADVRPVFARIDRLVGDVLDAVDEETNVVCCSTYGVAPVSGYRINVNEVLRDAGFLESAGWDEPSRPTLEVTGGPVGSQQGPFERAVRAGSRVVGGLGSLFERLAPRTPADADECVDWYSSLAYCPDETRLGLRVNLAGREPYGRVPPSRYEAVCSELVSLLSALETPDGEPAFEFVCRREHLYDGHFLDGAPDVLFMPSGANHVVSTTLSGRRFESVTTVGPRLEGAFVGAGPGFTGATVPHRLSVVDIGPITMALLGRPVPELMTGSVPEGLLVDPVARARYDDGVYGAAATDPLFDDGEVRSRLEDAGYR